MQFTQFEINQANETDLVDFLLSQGEEVTKSGREYRWKAHDSVCINNNQWFQHSQNRGGYPVDFVMNFYGLSFSDAVEALLNMKGHISMTEPNVITIEDEEYFELPFSEDEEFFLLPPKAENNHQIEEYLMNERGIDRFTLDVFEGLDMLYEDAEHHNCIFVGFDLTDGNRTPRYAHKRSTKEKLRMDIKGSDKSYGFAVQNIGCDELYVFESPIDLMSYISLYIGTNNYPNCISLGGVSIKALRRFLNENQNISNVILCLDSDDPGAKACSSIANVLQNHYTVTRLIPTKKDWNEMLVEHRKNPDFDISPGYKTLCELEPLELVCMDDIEIKPIKWLWYPFIPFAKYVLMQGDGGIGKTTLAIHIAAALTTGSTLPGMEEPLEPSNVIIQSAEDGYEDTIKPRLQAAGADMKKVHFIKEDLRQLTLNDSKVRRAIRATNAKLLIFDPIQAYFGKGVDMNRASDVRAVLSDVGRIADETGCTIMPIGHLNKNNSASINQRTSGSHDISSAARSVITVSKVKGDKYKRVMCQTKTNLAPEGNSLEFYLDKDKGFYFGDFCDLTYEELNGGKAITDDDEPTETKKDRAKRLILVFLSDVDEMESGELKEKVMNEGIGYNNFVEAKKELGNEGKILNFKTKDHWYCSINIPNLTDAEKASLSL